LSGLACEMKTSHCFKGDSDVFVDAQRLTSADRKSRAQRRFCGSAGCDC
jgi:hypothetical protein